MQVDNSRRPRGASTPADARKGTSTDSATPDNSVPALGSLELMQSRWVVTASGRAALAWANVVTDELIEEAYAEYERLVGERGQRGSVR